MEDLGLAVRTLSWITESIAITNFKTAFDTEALATNNLPVRAILCLDESTISTLPDARTVWHLQDGTNPPGLFSEAVRKLERLLAIHDRVLVHCRAGQSRSAAVVAGYLVCNGGMRVDEAIQYVTSKRPITKIMPGLLHHIHELEMRD
jgi:protein-tyrosine phosphatase